MFWGKKLIFNYLYKYIKRYSFVFYFLFLELFGDKDDLFLEIFGLI